MRIGTYFEGKHELSGVCHYVNVSEDTDIEGYVLTIDGQNYCAIYDGYDGYRSYGRLHPTSKAQTNPFPKQVVSIHTEIVKGRDRDTWYDTDYEYITIRNEQGEIILRVGTDFSDAYYPIGHLDYYPQNLPINKGK